MLNTAFEKLASNNPNKRRKSPGHNFLSSLVEGINNSSNKPTSPCKEVSSPVNMLSSSPDPSKLPNIFENGSGNGSPSNGNGILTNNNNNFSEKNGATNSKCSPRNGLSDSPKNLTNAPNIQALKAEGITTEKTETKSRSSAKAEDKLTIDRLRKQLQKPKKRDSFTIGGDEKKIHFSELLERIEPLLKHKLEVEKVKSDIKGEYTQYHCNLQIVSCFLVIALT